MWTKNSNDIIGNRTRDLPTCSAVPQPIAPPRAPYVPAYTWTKWEENYATLVKESRNFLPKFMFGLRKYTSQALRLSQLSCWMFPKSGKNLDGIDRQTGVECLSNLQCLQKLKRDHLLTCLKFCTNLLKCNKNIQQTLTKNVNLVMLFSCFMGHCPYVERSVVKTHGVEFLILSVKRNDACFCLSGAVDLTLVGRMKEITPMPTWRQELAVSIKQIADLRAGAINLCDCNLKRVLFSRMFWSIFLRM